MSRQQDYHWHRLTRRRRTIQTGDLGQDRRRVFPLHSLRLRASTCVTWHQIVVTWQDGVVISTWLGRWVRIVQRQPLHVDCFLFAVGDVISASGLCAKRRGIKTRKIEISASWSLCVPIPHQQRLVCHALYANKNNMQFRQAANCMRKEYVEYYVCIYVQTVAGSTVLIKGKWFWCEEQQCSRQIEVIL